MALFKKKDKNTKKGAENIIGKIIYGFLLFAPLLSIVTRCLYVIFNKNAYQSYSNTQEIVYKYETNEVNDYSDLQLHNLYHLDIIEIDSFDTSLVEAQSEVYIYINFANCYNTIVQQDGPFIEDVYNDPNNIFSVTYRLDGFDYATYVSSLDVMGGNFAITIGDIGYINVNQPDFFFGDQQSLQNFIKYYLQPNGYMPTASTYNEIVEINNNNGFLDNVFEYSINQTQQSNIYNWAKETGTYTVLQNATTGLGITNQFVPMLMAYWLIISVIYFLFDIALILIWTVHKKIHELTEAI